MTGNVFGERLRQLRVERGLTQEQLAHALGISWVTVSRYERGEYDPSLGRLRRIAAFFGVKPSDLLTETSV